VWGRAAIVPTSGQVRALLDEGLDYRTVGGRLGISPGLAYMIATGSPADGSDAPGPEERARRGLLPSSQTLSNPAPENPSSRETVHRWIAQRVHADAQQRGV
jgi:hypothetical protein